MGNGVSFVKSVREDGQTRVPQDVREALGIDGEEAKVQFEAEVIQQED